MKPADDETLEHRGEAVHRLQKISRTQEGRKLESRLVLVGNALNVGIVFLSLALAIDIFSIISVLSSLILEQVLGLALGFASSAALLIYAAGIRNKLLKYVLVFSSILMLAAVAYIVGDYWQHSVRMALAPTAPVLAALVILAVMVWSLKITSGISIVAVVVVFFLYAAGGHLLPEIVRTAYTPIDRLILYLVMDTNGVLGVALNVGLTVVVPYILFGSLLAALGGGQFFTDLAFAMMGRYRGGQAKVAVMASALFGTVSGSAVGNVASTGIVTIPLMKQAGYKSEEAGAIEAVASTGGQLIPPVLGTTAFVMAEFLAIPYSQVVLASLVPGFLYFFSLFLQVDLIAARRQISGSNFSDQPSAWSLLKDGWHFLLPFAVIFVMLFYYAQRPETAAVAAIAVLLISGIVRSYDGKRSSARTVLNGLVAAGDSVGRILIICAAAGIVIGVLGITGAAFTISSALLLISANNIVLLLCVTAILSIVLGMGMPTVGIYVLLAALVGPVLIDFGIEPIAAHMFILYFGLLSMVTPPVALASFAAANVARADPWETSWQSIRLGWSAYIVPFIFVASPSLLLITGHSLLETAHVAVTAIIGISAFCVGSIGFALYRLKAHERILTCIAGLCAIVPISLGPIALYFEAFGIALLVMILLLHFRNHKTVA